jgi:hypothetical protein
MAEILALSSQHSAVSTGTAIQEPALIITGDGFKRAADWLA